MKYMHRELDRIAKHLKWTLGGIGLIVCLAESASADNFRVLHSFTGPDGTFPSSRLTEGTDGNFYGTARLDDCPKECGLIFRITKTGEYTVLHRLSEADGGLPLGLVQAADGRFYGHAIATGARDGCGTTTHCGTLFRIDTAGHFKVLHNLGSNDDSPYPRGSLLLGQDGLLYGATASSIYRATTKGDVKTLHVFDSAQEGAGINGPLIQDDLGNLYGTAEYGGLLLCHQDGDVGDTCGTVFKLDTANKVTVFHFFGAHKGLGQNRPSGELVRGTDGFLYGTTHNGLARFANGPSGGGVFKIDFNGNYSEVHAFSSSDDYAEGRRPYAGLLATTAKFFGTNWDGGMPISDPLVRRYGTLFRMKATGKVFVLHTFHGPDGAHPLAGVVQGRDGNLYGTTAVGGATFDTDWPGKGTVFRLDPNAPTTVVSLTFGQNSVHVGERTSGQIVLHKPAPQGGLKVDLNNPSSGLVTMRDFVIIPEGENQGSFHATAIAAGTAKVWASGPEGAGPSVKLTILP